MSRTAKGFALQGAAELNGHDVVVVGASAGRVEALQAVVHELPGDLDATVFAPDQASRHLRRVVADADLPLRREVGP